MRFVNFPYFLHISSSINRETRYVRLLTDIKYTPFLFGCDPQARTYLRMTDNRFPCLIDTVWILHLRV